MSHRQLRVVVGAVAALAMALTAVWRLVTFSEASPPQPGSVVVHGPPLPRAGSPSDPPPSRVARPPRQPKNSTETETPPTPPEPTRPDVPAAPPAQPESDTQALIGAEWALHDLNVDLSGDALFHEALGGILSALDARNKVRAAVEQREEQAASTVLEVFVGQAGLEARRIDTAIALLDTLVPGCIVSRDLSKEQAQALAGKLRGARDLARGLKDTVDHDEVRVAELLQKQVTDRSTPAVVWNSLLVLRRPLQATGASLGRGVEFFQRELDRLEREHGIQPPPSEEHR